jgi:hypothetical protein
MRLAGLTAAVHAEFDVAAAMADVAAVCGHDRYQASAGIAAAAAYVAERARAAGLAEVAVLSFPADGARRWWTYHAPLPWTPVRARLRVGGTTLIRYPEQPYTLAAYSAATAAGGRPVRLVRWSAVRDGASPAGALVVVDRPAALAPMLGPLTAGGAIAVAADALAARTDRGPDQVGRLELPPGGRLSAFSVTAAQLSQLAAAADGGAAAVVEVDVDPTDRGLPVVTGRLPGTDDGEVLLSAHLCHPRPGANDNASGVAALLGIARVLVAGVGGDQGGAGPRGRAIRFVWGPEFVGLAAYLHDMVHAGLAALPGAAVNVDMAGQDVQRCGGPLVIERGPDDVPSFLPALAQRCAALLPPASRSYSGAVPCDPWTWRMTPFAGGSDHALLADAPTRCPVIALGHWPDRMNHSSADTLDVVDPAELRRCAVLAGTIAAAVRSRADPRLAADVAEATIAWGAEHVLATLPGRRPPPGPAARSGDGPVLDIRDEPGAGRWRRHRAAVALGAIGALGAAGASPAQLSAGAAWITSIVAAAERLSAAAAGTAADGAAGTDGAFGTGSTDGTGGAYGIENADRTGSADGAGDADGEVLVRGWAGPANLRALAAAATPADRDWLEDELARARGGSYARALALLHSLDGRRDRREAAWWAALSSELPVPVAFAERFFDLLCRAGWAVCADGDRR